MAKAPEVLSAPAVAVKHRGLLTVALMLATVMQVLDTTIANVALPHMASSLGAAQNEITWVLTSYIVAAAIATPLTGWLSDRMGQKQLFVLSVIGFTGASLLCGIATSLDEMVLFRIVQGLCGAIIAPLAQTVMLNINPRERVGQAMAIYGAGIMVGPIIGPTLGGWLTETLNWRWVFLVNLPVGILTVFMLFIYMPNTEIKRRPFDFFGFGMLALAVGALQLMLDRGADVGWFEATEVWIYLGLVITGAWVFVVHCATTEHPFVDLKIFKDRNFSMGLVFMFIIGITLFSGLALLPPLLQNLMVYPVITTGLVMAPRGVATMLSMVVVGRLVSKIDARLLVLFGLGLMAYSLYMMTGFSLQMDSTLIIVSGMLQGFGMGFVFVPLSTLTFATIAAKYRADGSSLFALVRNMGSGVGISLVTAVLATMLQVNHAELAARLTATAPAVINQLPSLLTGNGQIVSIVSGLVTQQAAMLSYLDDFLLMMFLSLAAVPIVLLLRGSNARKPVANAPKKSAEELALERAHAMAE
jgi:DHA2 family multidrug resistance protein